MLIVNVGRKYEIDIELQFSMQFLLSRGSRDDIFNIQYSRFNIFYIIFTYNLSFSFFNFFVILPVFLHFI